eukprot:426570_1
MILKKASSLSFTNNNSYNKTQINTSMICNQHFWSNSKILGIEISTFEEKKANDSNDLYRLEENEQEQVYMNPFVHHLHLLDLSKYSDRYSLSRNKRSCSRHSKYDLEYGKRTCLRTLIESFKEILRNRTIYIYYHHIHGLFN